MEYLSFTLEELKELTIHQKQGAFYIRMRKYFGKTEATKLMYDIFGNRFVHMGPDHPMYIIRDENYNNPRECVVKTEQFENYEEMMTFFRSNIKFDIFIYEILSKHDYYMLRYYKEERLKK